MIGSDLKKSPLGRDCVYVGRYDSSLLCPLSRQPKRREIGIVDTLPFFGCDLWNAYELSWLNKKGKPVVAVATVEVPCDSPFLIESKSFKLYLNSFNNSVFESGHQVASVLSADLSAAAAMPVSVDISFAPSFESASLAVLKGVNLDALDVRCDVYQVDPTILVTGPGYIQESLRSDLLKSNCLVTGQPDWGSLQVEYAGAPIDHASMLQYIVSYRDHQGFHEQCVEQIYCDIIARCAPERLTVYARYTRRGGLDINPVRSSAPISALFNQRLFRQ